MSELSPISNVRIFNPTGEGFTESEIPANLKELYSLLRGARRQKDNGLLEALSGCIATVIALKEFELLGGFDVKYNDTDQHWDAELVCVYSIDGERKELSPALSIMVVCLACANNVIPGLDCMKDCRATITTGDRVGKYRPVVFNYKPETKKAVDITRAIVLVSPGIVARYRGSYDIESCTYRDFNEQPIEVDDSLLSLGGSVL